MATLVRRFTLALAVAFLLALIPASAASARAAYEWVREWPVPDEASGIAVGTGS